MRRAQFYSTSNPHKDPVPDLASVYARLFFCMVEEYLKMASSSISVQKEDKLEGFSNFNVWKLRVMNILQEHKLDHFVKPEPKEPTSNARRAAFIKNRAKARRIIFDSVKDSIMIVMNPLMTPKECMDALSNIYEKSAASERRYLKHKLKYLKMEKGESVGAFCFKIARIRDQLMVTGIKVDDDDLVQAIYAGLPSS